MNGCNHFLRVSEESCSDVKTERKLIPRHRLEVYEDVIFGALSGRLDHEPRITSWIKTGVATHRFFKALPVPCRNVLGIVQRNETRVALLQVQRFDKAVEPKPVDLVFAGEHRPQGVQHIAIGAEMSFNDAICVLRLALKPQPSDILDRIPYNREQEKGGRNPYGQYQPGEHSEMKRWPGCRIRGCGHLHLHLADSYWIVASL